MAKRGRPTKFDDSIKGKVELLARRGFTDEEMSTVLGITERTFNNWKEAHTEFFQSLKDWKNEADSEIERSLYERALGYNHPEEKIFNNNGEIIRAQTTKHYPPDTTACIFWLKNRNSKDWSDRQNIEMTGKGGDPFKIEIEVVHAKK